MDSFSDHEFTNTLKLPRLAILKEIIDHWTSQLGAQCIRTSQTRNYMKDKDLSEEAVVEISEPLAQVLAHFGTKLPHASTFKVSCLLYVLTGKDVQYDHATHLVNL